MEKERTLPKAGQTGEIENVQYWRDRQTLMKESGEEDRQERDKMEVSRDKSKRFEVGDYGKWELGAGEPEQRRSKEVWGERCEGVRVVFEKR